jgi:hypothetical protein
MASGDDIVAGEPTTAYTTTMLIAEIPEPKSSTDFNGEHILAVLPNNDMFGGLQPLSRLNGIVGQGFMGGIGVTGNGGLDGGAGVFGNGGFRGGDGVVGSGATGSDFANSGPNAGAGVVATGGVPTSAVVSETNRRLNGPGLVAISGHTAHEVRFRVTGNMGVFSGGGDGIEETRKVDGNRIVVGPGSPGAGVVGWGGLMRSNGGNEDDPVETIIGAGAGVVGVAGNTDIPADFVRAVGVFGVSGNDPGHAPIFSEFGAGVVGACGQGPGVMGTSQRGNGLHGISHDNRGAILESKKSAQLLLLPMAKVPATAGTSPQVKGYPGDLLVTYVTAQGVEGVPDGTSLAELWFCNFSSAPTGGATNWVRLA